MSHTCKQRIIISIPEIYNWIKYLKGRIKKKKRTLLRNKQKKTKSIKRVSVSMSTGSVTIRLFRKSSTSHQLLCTNFVRPANHANLTFRFKSNRCTVPECSRKSRALLDCMSKEVFRKEMTVPTSVIRLS